MSIINKGITVIGIPNQKCVDNIKDIKNLKNDSLVISNRKESQNFNLDKAQLSLYVLDIIKDQNKILGLVVIDKLSGDIGFIKSNLIFLSAFGYEKIFGKLLEIGELYSDPFNLAIKLGLEIKDIGLVQFLDNGEITTFGQIINTSIDNLVIIDENTSIDTNFKPQHETNIHEFEELSKIFLSNIRIIPSLEMIKELQKQLGAIILKYAGNIKTEKDLKVASYLISTIKDGVERQAIEEFSDKTNVYQLIEMNELRGSINIAEMYLESALSQ